MTFRFDPERHEYWLGDRRLPSVSEIIAPLVDFSCVPEDRLAFARDRGTAVHLACHLDDMSTLDESTVDAEHVMPYLAAYRRWREECEVAVLISEEPTYSATHGFAGTPDRLVEMRMMTGGKYELRRRAIVDIKTVARMSPVTGVQLAGYDILADQHDAARVGLQLCKNGTYRMYKYGNETPTFFSLLNIWRWRQKHA